MSRIGAGLSVSGVIGWYGASHSTLHLGQESFCYEIYIS